MEIIYLNEEIKNLPYTIIDRKKIWLMLFGPSGTYELVLHLSSITNRREIRTHTLDLILDREANKGTNWSGVVASKYCRLFYQSDSSHLPYPVRSCYFLFSLYLQFSSILPLCQRFCHGLPLLNIINFQLKKRCHIVWNN